MQKSETIKELAAALVLAQAAMTNPAKNAENDHFHNQYADLPAVMAAVLPHLNAHGISVIQALDTTDDGQAAMTQVLTHTSGEWLSTTVPLACKDPTNPQHVGSSVTYFRRYLMAGLGVAQVDDDGNAGATAPADPPELSAGQKWLNRYPKIRETAERVGIPNNELREIFKSYPTDPQAAIAMIDAWHDLQHSDVTDDDTTQE